MPQTLTSTPCRRAEALPVLTAIVVALASTLVLTLAGCASTAGIAPSAQSVSPTTLGLVDTNAATPVATD